MKVKYGKGTTEYGPGVEIKLSGEDVARAIYTYLTAQDIHIDGAATIRVNGELCKKGSIYVDPSGYVVANGKGYSGRGKESEYDCRHAEDREKERILRNIVEGKGIDVDAIHKVLNKKVR